MEKKKEIEQLNMELKEPISNRFRNFKYKIELFFVKLRTNSLFTAPFLWISSALTLALILTQTYYYTNFIDRLPREVPTFLIAKTPALKLMDKDFLLWIIIISIALAIASVIISVRSYYKFKLISIFIMTNLVLAMLLLTISYIKIFGIYIF